MKAVASSVNESRRKVENIEEIARWQRSIEAWEVWPDLVGFLTASRSLDINHVGFLGRRCSRPEFGANFLRRRADFKGKITRQKTVSVRPPAGLLQKGEK